MLALISYEHLPMTTTADTGPGGRATVMCWVEQRTSGFGIMLGMGGVTVAWPIVVVGVVVVEGGKRVPGHRKSR